GISVAAALLLVVSGSNWSLWLIAAELVRGPGLTTLAWRSRVSGVVGLTVPTFQVPEALSELPWLGVAATKGSPAGRRACTRTPVASSGPRLARVTVKVTVSPTLGVALLTALARARSACWGVSVALAMLLPGSGSNWSAALTAAAFVAGLELTTVAVSVS